MILNRNRASRETCYIRINTRLCLACWDCIKACRSGVIGKIDFLGHRHARIQNAGNCIGCLACVKVCRQNAIRPLAGEAINIGYNK